MTAHEEEIQWELVTSEELGMRAAASFDYVYVPVDVPSRIDLMGPCPRCGHETNFEWYLVVLRSAIEASHASVWNEEEISMRCACTSSHTNRPKEEAYGCGAYWKLVVPRG